MPEPTIAGLLRDVAEAQEHLLIQHANMDAGRLVGDVRTAEKSYVLRDSFRSPCTSPHDCWSHLEAVARALAEGTLKLAERVATNHSGSVALTIAANEGNIEEWISEAARSEFIASMAHIQQECDEIADEIRALQPERADGDGNG